MPCDRLGSASCGVFVTLTPLAASDLIESLSADRARLLEEKKRLEEEVGRLRGAGPVPSPSAVAPELYGACAAAEPPGEVERPLLPEAPDEGRADPALETSTMSVQ